MAIVQSARFKHLFYHLPPFWAGALAGALVSILVVLSGACLLTSCLSGLLQPSGKCSIQDQQLANQEWVNESGRVAMQEGNPASRPQPQDSVPTRAAHIERLLAEVRKHVAEDIRERCVAVIEGRPGSLYQGWAQAGQDWLLFHNYFFHIPYGKGKYVDIGSNHPVDLSNTFFFDRCLGWRGACIEPNPEYHPLYPQHGRTCALVKNCLNDQAGTMFFSKWGVLGQLFPTRPTGVKAGQVIEIQCRTLPDVLVEHDLADADLASIDIEGAEGPTLRCFPFAAFSIATWIAEVDKSPTLYKLFMRAGYAHVMDIICPVEGVFSNMTRVGWELDSVFRLQPPLVLGPPFLPGGPLFRSGPRGPCSEEEVENSQCPEQVPIMDRLEVNWRSDWTLKKGECKLPYPKGSGLSSADFEHPLSRHPAVGGAVLRKRIQS